MANIKIGNLEIDNLKVGTLSVDALYIGDVKIYPPTPTPAPTDNWVLVEEDVFDNPRKIKVDYSLIEDDDSEIGNEYMLDSHVADSYSVTYFNQPTLEWLVEHGYCSDDEIEDLYQKVGLFSRSDGIIAILEDGVEYTSIGGVNLSDYSISYNLVFSNPNYYLYATK